MIAAKGPGRPAEGALLSVRGLRTAFETEAGLVRAVDGVSFDVGRGEVVAIVGESGSGKSVTAMSILGLLPSPPAQITGEVLWKGENLMAESERRRRQVRGGEIAMIFQDPLSALNPCHTVGRQVAEMVRLHRNMGRRASWAHAVEMLALVGIPQPARRALMHPHEFSGGMRQRAMIAMAIACRPDLLIADEPTTALDVTVQAQVLEVLVAMKEEIDSAMLLITHDLGVVAGLADRVVVMYAGRHVETGTADEVFYESRHPYSRGLLEALPRLDGPADAALRPIGGAPPSLLRVPAGCAFHPRCPIGSEHPRCRSEAPELRPLSNSSGLARPGHRTACHFAELVGLDECGVGLP